MFKPMKPAKPKLDFEWAQLEYPLLASPKLDGYRCIIRNGVGVTASLEEVPNRRLADMLRGLPCFDGELISGSPVAPDVCNRTGSIVRSHNAPPDATLWVFDVALNDTRMPFNERYALAKQWVHSCGKHVQLVEHVLIKSHEQLMDYESKMLSIGYEGICVRSLSGPYKHGRSTINEGYLLAMKRFKDSEAKIIGFVEELKNNNEQTVDNMGRSKRAGLKANKTPKGTLGALKVQDIYTGVQFEIGTGLTADERTTIWANQDGHLGMLAKYKFMAYGTKDKPRHPVFLGFRDEADL